MPRLKDRYREQVIPGMMEEFDYDNVMQCPRLEKIVVNIGLGEAMQDAKVLDAATEDLRAITGQQPALTRARRSIAAFKLRAGREIGAKVTLRGDRMWDFFDRLCNVALPRRRDFRGISPNSFDGRGNYSIGLREQLVFPEVSYEKIDKVRGMEIAIVTSAQTDEEGRRLLAMLGMPFAHTEL
jgi:large subunit ribosomal protein L5